jgi:two-component system NarL family sensor kinase
VQSSPPRSAGPTWARWLRVALVVLAACAPQVLLGLGRLGEPADGTATFPSAPAWGDGVVLAEVIGQAGDLRAGDRVVSVEGIPLETWVDDPPPAGFRVGQVLRYGVRRGDTDGATAGGGVTTVDVVLRPYPLAEIAIAHAVLHPLLIGLFAVAAFVFLRRPADPAARALFRLAVLVPLGAAAFPYSTQVIDIVTGRLWPLVVSDIASLFMWGALLHFTMVFPRPRGPVARHPRLAAAVAYAVPVLAYLVHLANALPAATGALERVGRLVTISVPAANTTPLLAAFVMIVSYLSARDAPTRQRLLWVFVAIAFGFLAYVGLGRLPERLLGSPLVPWDWLALAFLPVPIAVAAAVLRYRLFEVEVFLRRSLVYGGLAGILGLIYLGAAVAFGRLFGTPVDIGPLLAGAVVVVLVLSLRERLRRVVMRLIFGDRDDPYEVVRQLGQRLEATASPDSVLRSVVETLAQALRLPYVAVELTGVERLTASHGEPSGQPLTIPLTHRGEEVGRLVLDTGPVREPFGPDDRRLLDGLAGQVGMTAHNLLLTARLQRSLERVVTAREEERRRLRRDIHDGLGPVLASGGMRLEVARALLRTDPEAAQDVLTELGDTQRQALVDLRRLVEGLRPPVLDQLGLVGAVRERADRFTGERNLVVTVDAATDLEPLPAAVEVAAYHIVSEALTNVVKHARARACTVRMWRDGALRLEIRDDGTGLPDGYRAGMGLHSIRERAAELGGEASAIREATGGTTIRSRLPLPSPAPVDAA